MTDPRVRVHLAVSVDGYIAADNGGIDWLQAFPPEDFGFDTFLAGIGGIIMGRTTYDDIRRMEGDWPYGERRTVVITTRALDPHPPAAVEATDDLQGGLAALKRQTEGDIWICGGGRVVRQLLDLDLVDTLEIAVLPVLLGTGLPLFERAARGHALRLVEAQRRGPGVVMIYEVLKEQGRARQ